MGCVFDLLGGIISFVKSPGKFISTAILMVAIWQRSGAQDYQKVYFNSEWIVTSIENASYYRTSGFKSSLPSYDGEVSDYYIKNDQLEMTGSYNNGLKEGEFRFYFSDGKVRLIASFKNNNRAGTWEEFYQNGQMKVKLSYSNDSEMLLELNDSLGNSRLKQGSFKYRLQYVDILGAGSQRSNKEEWEVSGSVMQTLREGRWNVRKNGQSYASMVYKAGILEKGYYFQNNQRIVLNSNLVFPLILDPVKFYMTENFVFQEGSKIKNNYVTEGLHQHKFNTKKRIVIKSYEDVVNYVTDNFDLRSKKKNEIISIKISTLNGVISDFTTEPKISVRGMENLKLVLDTIERLEFAKDETLTIQYMVNLEGRIGN